MNEPKIIIFLCIIFFLLAFSLVFTVQSLEFFQHSFKTFPFYLLTLLFIIYLYTVKKVKLSILSVYIILFLFYSFSTTVSGYYYPDGLFLLYFLFVLFILYTVVENLNQKDKYSNYLETSSFRSNIVNIIFLISFLNTLFTYTGYCLKAIDHKTFTILPYFLYFFNPSPVGGFLYQPNLNALLINLGLVITIFKTLNLEQNYKRNSLKTYAKLIIIYIFFALGSSFTSSRAGLFAILFVFLFILIHKIFFRLEMSKKEISILFGLFLLYLSILFLNKYSSFAKFSHNDLIGDNSLYARIMIWTATILLWLKHPLFGTGLETFKFLNNPYQIKACNILKLPIDLISNFTWAHNEPIQILEELGVFAFLAVISITVIYYLKILKKDKRIENLLIPSLILIFIVQAGLSWPLRHPALLALFFVIIALTDKKRIFVLKGAKKNVFVSTLLLVYIGSTIYMFPHIKNDIYYTFKLSRAKSTDKKLNLLYKASQDNFLFWIASSKFLYLATPYYLEITAGIDHIPMIKEDIKDKKITKKNEQISKKLKKEIFIEARNLEKIDKIWLSEYYLSLAYLFNNNLEQAKLHVKKALEMNPNPQYLWSLLHFINVKYASLKTGKPISAFLPSKKEVDELHKQFKIMIEKIKKTNQK